MKKFVTGVFDYNKDLEENSVLIANRIFEIRLYNIFLTSAAEQGTDIYEAGARNSGVEMSTENRRKAHFSPSLFHVTNLIFSACILYIQNMI